MRQSVSGATITELYNYLRVSEHSYNQLRVLFRNCRIEPGDDVPQRSSRHKDQFLDEYIVPLKLGESSDAGKFMAFIEQILDIHLGSPVPVAAESLVASLCRDGWNIVGNHLVIVGSGVEELVESMLRGQPADTIEREWDRARQSLLNDPADALTAASAMVEATYKYILYRLGKPFPSSQDIQHLAGAVHPLLLLAPDQQSDQDIKRCMGGLLNVVGGLGTIRTKIGDAHGAEPTRGTPLAHHARLAINAAGTLSLFLIETYLEGMTSEAGGASLPPVKGGATKNA